MDIILVSTADWDNPYWTNKQHMAVQFAALGHRVFYVESQGLRAPTATAKDLKRIWKRLKRGLRSPKNVYDNIWVWSPLNIPMHGNPLIRRLNKLLLQSGIRLWCTLKGIRPQVLWTYSPMTTEFYDLDRFKLCVYHAVDDVKTQPGVPREAIEKAESVLSREADLIFVTAPNLYNLHKPLNKETHYFSNVADYRHFNQALREDLDIPEDIALIPGPRIGFVGAISSYKLDFEMIKTIAERRPQWSFVFVGEIGEGDPLDDSSALEGVKNLHFLGGKSYTSLPAYLKAMDVVLLPNKINEYTRSMFPMKFFEYLSSGRPVVSTELPALSEYTSVAAFCKTTDEFEGAIDAALQGNVADLEERLAIAREQTYEIRTQKMMAHVDAALAGSV
ncbi:glycosyl transferase family 1 [Rhizobium azibense]|uniref:Glycosyl transferase family 1 n=1 Tax=Rhizobium azibense TaxID=1136135 RepID=A0A4V2VC65_9HYPH|nr:glycosyltransferase [Rhizobium azibense]TCU13567.1 glycosyl transferase family 1 [Rhizobium azibense]TCU27595.1 glycosyl transferase family 1 [Rhizobium azibense]